MTSWRWLELVGAHGIMECKAPDPARPEGADTRMETRLAGRVGDTR
ncbi:hypothetical protein TIFTF001_007805 [Ficus carica]|uniref:Uncharacterized protein n=1 Tax=Ficus carica TaxID=3494 RepID=A0AA87ZK86_FICCA|nr:hypothetical protein TIFTF001_007805 [Ficus carica]